jgi:hypothetical protein
MLQNGKCYGRLFDKDRHHASECGQIDIVKSKGPGGSIVVELACYAAESRQRPFKYKDT